MKRLLLTVILLVFIVCAYGQKVNITNIDDNAYPKITVSFTISDKASFQNSELKLVENNNEIPFQLVKKDEENKPVGRNICFLIEASGYTTGIALQQFKKAVGDALNDVAENDLVNVGYFGSANSDGKSLNVLSAEFTNDKEILKNEITNKVVASWDSRLSSDLYKGIYECLDFMNSKQNLGDNKMLIVISVALNSSKSPITIEDCIEKSIKYNIPVYSVTYKTVYKYASDYVTRLSDKTNGRSTLARNADEITIAVKEFIADADKNIKPLVNNYSLTFDATQSEKINAFEIQYKDEKVNGSYEFIDVKESFVNKYWMLIFAAIALLGFILTLVLYLTKGNKADYSGQQKIKELEERNLQLMQQLRDANTIRNIPPPVQEPPSVETNKTIIPNTGGIPMLMVSTGSYSRNYPLTKMQISIGRTPDNDIVIPEITVSANHADIVNEAGEWYVIDNNSTNGTFVNGVKVTRQLLHNSDIIKMGAATLNIQF